MEDKWFGKDGEAGDGEDYLYYREDVGEKGKKRGQKENE